MRILIVVLQVLAAGIVCAEEESLLFPIEDINEEELAIQVAQIGSEAICLSRNDNRQFDLLIAAFQNYDLVGAAEIWSQLVQELIVRGGAVPNFGALMLTSAREAFLDGHPELEPAADKLRFETERLQIIRKEILLLEARIRTSTTQDEVDRLILERHEREVMEEQQEQALDDAKEAYREYREQFKDVMELLVEAVELETQVIKNLQQ